MRSVIFCIIVFTVMGIMLTIYQDVAVTTWERPIWNKIATVILFDLMMLVIYWTVLKKQKTIYENLENRQSLARMVIDNGWYETDAKQSGRGERDMSYYARQYYYKRRGITYFPKLYYLKKNGKICVTVKISMGRCQEQLLNLETKLETGLDCELISKNYRHKWVYYAFLCDVEKNRININDIEMTGGILKLMRHIEWNYDRFPHVLIAGTTGSGKTYLILILVEILLDIGANVYIADAKNADLAGLEMVLPEVYHTKEDIAECVSRFYEAMIRRSDEMKQMPDYTPGKNYAAFGLTPNFLIFDEYVAYMEMLVKKESEEVVSLLKKIILLGRQAGFFLILACQRPDAKYLGDGTRDQFGFRVALGSMSASGYTMMFGSTDKEFLPKDIKGHGYVDAGNGIVTEFYVPFVPDEHNFVEEIRRRSQSGDTVGEEAGRDYGQDAASV